MGERSPISLEEYLKKEKEPKEVHLTPRHIELMQGYVDGLTSGELLGVMDIAPKTIDNFRSQIIERLRNAQEEHPTMRRAIYLFTKEGVLDGSKVPPLPRHTFTRREVEVLSMLVEGYRNHEMAEEFVVSNKTIDSHVTHIIDKFGCSGSLQVIASVAHFERVNDL